MPQDEYVRRLAVVGAASALFAGVAAWTMHFIQHARWNEAYLLVPVNSFWLYFLPIAFFGVTLTSSKANRLNLGLVLGTALVWIWAGARVIYWTWMAGQLVGRPGVREFSMAVREHALSGVIVGATGLLSFCVFALGAVESIRRTATSGGPLRTPAAR
jgi:hypothetical protein